MKYSIEKAEWYPVYTLNDEEEDGRTREVVDDLAERYKKLLIEFDEVQHEIRNIYDTRISHD